ncbi:4-hydroxy-2-oxovalerate aldolase [Flaviflexus ciconiae]|uniref:4-hydroxy-2-oxovalerate aldolase n=1 Tax=Flaviflexus ciconiae TaxID=2496867 RepID=A0A3S9PUX6_9ACTO|nr:aldolase/citrate lyase family protein [Flaviflexus ciconiae]AZQ76159.1 4-hydroxy-2-oxovalerate aldolase [Flaviflexus ciconiae]
MAIPEQCVWLSEPSTAKVDIAKLTGFDGVILDVEHGLFELRSLDWMVSYIKANGLRAIVKVLGPEREPIQQALDFGADAVVIPHVESVEHAMRVTAFAKFPPLGDRSLAGGRTATYVAYTDEGVAEMDRSTKCYPMIEDAGALEDVEEILALDTVDGIFVGPTDLALRREGGIYTANDAEVEDILRAARAANAAGKPWIFPAWSAKEQDIAVRERAAIVGLAMEYSVLYSGFAKVKSEFEQIVERNGS